MLSVPFTFRSVETEIADALRWHLAPFRRKGPEQQAVPLSLFEDEDDAGKTEPPTLSFFKRDIFGFKSNIPVSMLTHMLWDIHALIPQVARDFLFLHAGAVARDGAALLLSASMDVGKSSLTAALLLHDYDYLSDELGCIDPITSRAFPFQKHITLGQEALDLLPGLEGRLDDRRGLSGELQNRYVRPEDCEAVVSPHVPVRWLVFPTPERNGTPRLIRMTQAEAVEAMAANCFNLYRYAERGVILLSRVAAGAGAWRLEGGTPLQRAELLAERLAP